VVKGMHSTEHIPIVNECIQEQTRARFLVWQDPGRRNTGNAGIGRSRSACALLAHEKLSSTLISTEGQHSSASAEHTANSTFFIQPRSNGEEKE
jgi:hypothetical protein